MSSATRSNYITSQGAARLRAELKTLWKEERPEITAIVKAAAANGDRSENGDYLYGKKRLRGIDRRVRYLTKRLEQLQIVEQLPRDQSRIYFGAWITYVVIDIEGSDENIEQQKCIRIVGPDEIDPIKGYISIDSPIARALIKKGAGDELTYHTPRGPTHIEIINVSYTAS